MKMQKWFIFKLYCGLSFCRKGSIYLQADEKEKKMYESFYIIPTYYSLRVHLFH